MRESGDLQKKAGDLLLLKCRTMICMCCVCALKRTCNGRVPNIFGVSGGAVAPAGHPLVLPLRIPHRPNKRPLPPGWGGGPKLMKMRPDRSEGTLSDVVEELTY